jgi:mRNA-degrading endonuclease RelE of RelBE toxin-antitoxin system
MYELRFHPQVDKELALLPKQVREIIKDEKMSGGLKSSATCVFTAGNRS